MKYVASSEEVGHTSFFMLCFERNSSTQDILPGERDILDTECFISPSQDQSQRTQSKTGRVFQTITDISTNHEPAAPVFVVLNHYKENALLYTFDKIYRGAVLVQGHTSLILPSLLRT
jgi:hypothetical protein